MQWIYMALFTHVLSLHLLAFLFFAALRRTARGLQERVFLFFAIALFAWILFDGLALALYAFRLPHLYISALAVIAAHAAVFMLYAFCEIFPNNSLTGSARSRVSIIGVVSVPISLLAFSPDWASNRRIDDNGLPAADLGPFFVISGIWLCGIAVFGIGILALRLRKIQQSLQRNQVRFFLAGASVTVVTTSLFSMVLPLFSIRQFDFLGVNAGLVLIATTIYAILAHRMFELRTRSLRAGLKLVSSVVVASGLYYFLAILLPDQLNGSRASPFIIMGLLFLSGLLFGRKIQPRLETIFFGAPVRYEDAVIELFHRQETSGPEAPLEVQLADILEILQKRLHFERGFILTPEGAGGVRIHSITSVPAFLVNMRDRHMFRLNHHLQLPEDSLRVLPIVPLDRHTSNPNTLDNKLWGRRAPRLRREFERILNECRDAGYLLFVPLVAHRQIGGYIVLGERSNGLPYSASDIRLLEALRGSVALAVRNRLYYEETQRQKKEAESEVEALTHVISARETVSFELGERTLLYRSTAMNEVMEDVRDTVRTEHPVLITGETGTGKELIARLIHKRGTSADQPFIAMNCASIPESLWEDELFGHVRGAFTDARKDRPGRLQEAAEGVLFFDEIGEMPLDLQAKLLRILQERVFTPLGEDKTRPVRCRFIFATNRDLQDRVGTGHFREDLYFRINVFPVHLPPLRQRREDILILADHLLHKYATELYSAVTDFTGDALEALRSYDWPGNIREMENVIIRAVAMASRATPGFPRGNDVVTREALPLVIRNSRTRKTTVGMHETAPAPANHNTDSQGPECPDGKQLELISVAGDFEDLVTDYRRLLIETALKRSDRNRTRAAALLGIKRGRLLYQMNELGID